MSPVLPRGLISASLFHTTGASSSRSPPRWVLATVSTICARRRHDKPEAAQYGAPRPL
jgi:hypothetical protein